MNHVARVFIGWQPYQHMFANRSQVVYEFINTKKLVKKLARIEASSFCRQQFANVFADCFCAVHTHQLEFVNFSLPCEGRFTVYVWFLSIQGFSWISARYCQLTWVSEQFLQSKFFFSQGQVEVCFPCLFTQFIRKRLGTVQLYASKTCLLLMVTVRGTYFSDTIACSTCLQSLWSACLNLHAFIQNCCYVYLFWFHRVA